jgi:squalene-hopene/tetraprenyl-beta-curcumene cyclase
MHFRFSTWLALTSLGLAGSSAARPHDDAAKAGSPAQSTCSIQAARTAAERGLAFLKADAEKWRKERKCASCHHGTMTVWAFAEAQGQGYPVDGEYLEDVAAWTEERLANIDKPRDTRPGWSMVNTPAVLLALMSLALPKQEAISPDQIEQIADHLVRHQEKDGSWAWSSAPAQNRPPPVFESDEVVTLMAYVALGPHAPSGSAEKSPGRASRERADLWLRKNQSSRTTQATALELFRRVQAGQSRKEIDAAIDQLLRRQNHDGGWGQNKDLRSDAYATGQALYFLKLAGASSERQEIQRALSFLVATQRSDGSWPMTSRAHPGAKPMTNPVPITYFGSAWGTMGLLRWAPKESPRAG